MGPRDPNLPNAKRPQCLICSVTAAIYNSTVRMGGTSPFKTISDLYAWASSSIKESLMNGEQRMGLGFFCLMAYQPL